MPAPAHASSIAGTVLPSPRRAIRMVQRNLLVYKHSWMVIFSGFFEPVFYLLSMGVGIGGMVPDVNGISYTAFVAPGLLASSCMNGAISDGLFNIFDKLRYRRTYDAVLATPMRVADIALGEMLWATARGSLYSVGFLSVVLAFGELYGPRVLLSATAVFALPAAILLAGSLSAMALCATSFLRSHEDFDKVIGLVVMPMFLFSGTFFPLTQLPSWLQWVFQLVPLYHGVELLRALTTGALSPIIWWHVAFLIVSGTVALAVAMRRLERALIK